MIGYWADYFETNLAAVAFIGSIMNGIAFGNGPIVACLIKKFGCRAGKNIFYLNVYSSTNFIIFITNRIFF